MQQQFSSDLVGHVVGVQDDGRSRLLEALGRGARALGRRRGGALRPVHIVQQAWRARTLPQATCTKRSTAETTSCDFVDGVLQGVQSIARLIEDVHRILAALKSWAPCGGSMTGPLTVSRPHRSGKSVVDARSAATKQTQRSTMSIRDLAKSIRQGLAAPDTAYTEHMGGLPCCMQAQAADWMAWLWDCPHRAGLDDLGVLVGAPPALPPPQAAADQQQHCRTTCRASELNHLVMTDDDT